MGDQTQGDKPELTLLPGSQILNAEAIAEFYTKLTGKVPTEADLERVRKYLKEHTPAP